MIRSRTFAAIFLASTLVGAALEGIRRAVAQDLPPGLDVRLTRAEGVVDVKFKGQPDWAPGDADTPLEPGDELRAGAGARAELGWGAQSLYELQESGRMVLAESSRDKKMFALAEGTFLVEIHKLEPGETVQVRTLAGAVRDMGTDYGVTAHPDGSTSVGVFEGEVAVSPLTGATGAEAKIPAGKEYSTADRGLPPRSLKTFLLFQGRIKELTARRIILRRDWKPMTSADRYARRKTMYDDRAARAVARSARLKQEQEDAKAAQAKAAAARAKAEKSKKKKAAKHRRKESEDR